MDQSGNNSQMQATANNMVKQLGNIYTALMKVFPSATGTTTSATGGAATLPSNPVGFLEVTNPTTGEIVKIPFYN